MDASSTYCVALYSEHSGASSPTERAAGKRSINKLQLTIKKGTRQIKQPHYPPSKAARIGRNHKLRPNINQDNLIK